MQNLRLAFAFAFALAAAAAGAHPLTFSLAPSDPAAAAGRETQVDLVVLNRDAHPQPFTAPATLSAQLTLDGRARPVELRLVSPGDAAPRSVPPGAFVTVTYAFAAPAVAAGTAIVETRLADASRVRGVIDLFAPSAAPAAAMAESTAGAQPASSPSAPVAKPTTSFVRAEPAASAIQRTFANRLAPHEPIYFIYGRDAPVAKFQFSFKYRLLNFTDLADSRLATTLQFAFTQRSLWDISADSSPFYDTSYMPEVIFEALAPKPEEKDTWLTWLGYQVAFKHESNGRDGLISRSLNTVYLRTVVAFGHLEGWHLLVIPEIWGYVTPLDDNRDLRSYRGHGQLRLVLGRNDGPSLMVSTWAGKDFDHASLQLDLTFPVRTKLLNFETYLLFQYFNGYGESLLHYDQPSKTVRAGISLVR